MTSPISPGLTLDLQYGALLGYGYDLSSPPDHIFTAEQELELSLTLYRRALCLTNNLVLDVPISSCIPKIDATTAVYEIKGTQYCFSEAGELLRQSFTLQNPIQRDSSGNLVYSSSKMPNFLSGNLFPRSKSTKASVNCEYILILKENNL